MKKDDVFKNEMSEIKPFHFDQTIADAFDDMAKRSIPFYNDLQAFITKIVKAYYQSGTKLYDLGCSTGNTVSTIHKNLDHPVNIIAVDKSEEMIRIAKHKCQAVSGVDWQIKGIEEVVYSEASIINVSYVLQFIDPDKRQQLLQAMYKGLVKKGALIFSEKIYCDKRTLNDVSVDQYWEFKRSQGYSELEIRQKEDALKNVLLSFTREQYEKMLMEIGFQHIEITFKYMNFVSMVAFK